MNRHERRKAMQGQKRNHNSLETIKSELYAFDDDSGLEQWLDVLSMRKWAEIHLELVRVAIDMKRVTQIFASDAINRDHLMKHTIRHKPRPIIICTDLCKEGDQIVDGNHTYVAAGMAAALGQQQGFKFPAPPSVEGWTLSKEQWMPFIIPRSVVIASKGESKLRKQKAKHLKD